LQSKEEITSLQIVDSTGSWFVDSDEAQRGSSAPEVAQISSDGEEK